MRLKSRYFIQYILCVAFFFMVSCEKDENEPEKVRTLMVYLVGQGDDKISYYLKNNIKDMAGAWKKGYKGDIVIYYDADGAAPQLLTFKIKNGVAEQEILRTYDDDLNSADPATLQKVIGDMQSLYPSDSYGIIFGGHASGWLLLSAEARSIQSDSFWDNPISRSFADKKFGKGMDIREMAKIIPAEGVDFILFDACMMSSVEALYEFRYKTKYIIACPTETQIQGFPYSDVMSYFWGKGADLERDLKNVCETYYEYYNTYNDKLHFGSIALINTAELDNLYNLTRQLLCGRASEAAKIGSSEVICIPWTVNRYDMFFDLRDYVRYMSPDQSFRNIYDKQLAKVVLYHAFTESFYNNPISADKYCGITTYIPLERYDWRERTAAYWNFPWAGVYDKDATE
ncbi:clostripain-related cysteine peptidase [Butyricimonas hominis]|uniref:clostripain-related cysteine peptidase n=1 Tax=Butyricimonas TaxID=574697 RepID=UPI0035115C00